MSTVDISMPCPHWQARHDAIEETAERAARMALAHPDAGHAGEDYEVSIVLADDALVRGLNRQYRNIDKPTNVLSFPAEDDEAQGPCLLGDVVLAYETIEREALASGTPMLDHVAHLIVHGALHLLGFDHEEEEEAEAMEAHETAILARLGVKDPYHRELKPGG